MIIMSPIGAAEEVALVIGYRYLKSSLAANTQTDSRGPLNQHGGDDRDRARPLGVFGLARPAPLRFESDQDPDGAVA